MNILALETSVPQASLCLLHEGKIIYSTSWIAERNHDAHLFPALQQAMDLLGDKPVLNYILVGAGPGSYGGVRVSLAAGVGIAAVTGARLVAVESWAQLAEEGTCVVADARRGGWTVRQHNGDISVMSPEQLRSLGLLLHTTEASGVLHAKGFEQIGKEALVPTAEGLIQTWFSMTELQREELAAKPAEPIYVRPPHITSSTRKPWEI